MVQWRVFAEHIALDRKEHEEFSRDLVEYGMAFHNFEAVKQVQQAREAKQRLEDQQTTEIFMEQVEKLFGKKLDPSHLNEAKDNPDNQVNEEDLDQQQDTIKVFKSDK